jgi:hypothetical protein
VILKAEWENLHKQLFPNGSNPIQREEMKKSFYCGILCMQTLEAGLADKTEAEAVATLAALHEECREFFRITIARQKSGNGRRS